MTKAKLTKEEQLEVNKKALAAVSTAITTIGAENNNVKEVIEGVKKLFPEGDQRDLRMTALAALGAYSANLNARADHAIALANHLSGVLQEAGLSSDDCLKLANSDPDKVQDEVLSIVRLLM